MKAVIAHRLDTNEVPGKKREKKQRETGLPLPSQTQQNPTTVIFFNLILPASLIYSVV
jgi:hypothetical protein